MKKSRIKFSFILLIIIVPWIIKGFWLEKNELSFTEPKKINIIDNGHFYQIFSSENRIAEFLEKNKIVLAEKDLIFPSIEAEIIPNMNIKIKRATKIKILVDGQEIEISTLKDDVKGAIEDTKISLNHLDLIEPVKDTLIYEDLKIKITRIEIEEITREEKIDFKTVEKEDSDLKWRKEKIVQEGEEGIKNVQYRLKYKNGKLVEEKKLSSETIKKPVDKIVAVGTKIEVGQTKTGLASWYSYQGGMFCASRMFPRGTWLRVTNRTTGKKIFVQVNDYGPMRGTGKMIDLDKVAFEKIGNLGQGVIEVKVEEILD